MKNLLVYFLIILISLPMFSRLATFVTWKINQEFIAQNFCVNRDKKELKCKGKCQLMKNLNENEDNTKAPLPQKPKEIKLQPFVLNYLPILDFSVLSDHESKSLIWYRPHIKTSDFHQCIFSPPDASLRLA